MRILLNHTLRSIRDNIGQLITVILTVTVVTMLFFVTLTIGGLFTNLQTSLKARLGRDSDIAVTATVFSEAQLDEFCEGREDIKYVEKYLQTAALYKPKDGSYSKTVMVEATDLRAFSTRHGKELTVYESYEYSSDFPSVWVGRSFAEENGISAGDSIDIYIEMYKSYRTLTVNYIFENYGFFANNVVNSVLTDFSSVGNKGMISVAYIYLGEGAEKAALSTELAAYMGEGITVGDGVDYEKIYDIVESNQRLLTVTLVFVTALMIFILVTSFLVVAKKRVSELTVFKAVGATNGQIAAMLILEGMFYGFTGAILGVVLGRIGMGIAVSKVIPNFPDAVKYSVLDYILSIIFGVAVSAVSALFPVLKAGRESVRTATGDKAKAVKKRNPVPLAVSAGLFIVSAVLTAIFSGNVACVVILVILAGFFTYFVTPYLLKGVSAIFRGRGIVSLSGMTIKRNPSGNTLSGMVAVIIVFTFAVVGIVNVIIGAVEPKNSRFEADFVVESVAKTDMKEVRNSLEKVYGVKNAYLYTYDTFVWTAGEKTEYTVYGVENAEALSGLCSVGEDVKRRFATEINPIIITYDIANRFGLSVGDKIKLRLGTKEREKEELSDEFCVVGIDSDTVTSDDRMMIITNDAFCIGGRKFVPDKGIIFLYTEKNIPLDDLYRDLRDIAESNSCFVLGLDDWAYATSVGVTGIAALLRILEIAVGLVALAGVVNLTVVMIMDRKREYGILRSVGLDDKNYFLLGIFEGLIISLTGATIGVLLSVVVNVILPDFAKIIDRYVSYSFFPWELAVIAVVFVAVYTAVFAIAALLRRDKKRKLQLKKIRNE